MPIMPQLLQNPDDPDRDAKDENAKGEEHIFPSFWTEPESGDTIADAPPVMEHGTLLGTFSPATSEPNYFSMPLDLDCQNIDFDGFHNTVQTSESGLTEILSAPTSVTNSPIAGMDFSLDKFEDFPFDNPELFW